MEGTADEDDETGGSMRSYYTKGLSIVIDWGDWWKPRFNRYKLCTIVACGPVWVAWNNQGKGGGDASVL